MARQDDDLEPTPAPGRSVSAGMVLGAVLGAALVLFVVQNTRRITVEWLVFETRQPLWLVLLVTAAVSAVVVELVSGARRRRRRRS